MLAFVCAVAWVIDGDTFICRDKRHIRLAGIDAPELAGHCQAWRRCAPGNPRASLHALIALAKGRQAQCEDLGRSYDRVLAFCSVDGRDLSCAMLTSGMAIRRYSYGSMVCRKQK